MKQGKFSNESCLQKAKILFVDHSSFDDKTLITFSKLFMELIHGQNLSQGLSETYVLKNVVEICDSLPKRQQELIELRYYWELTFTSIAKKWSLSKQRVGQIHASVIRYLHSSNIYFLYSNDVQDSLLKAEEEIKNGNKSFLYCIPIEVLNISVRICNALKRAKILTIGHLLELEDYEILRIKNLGHRCFLEIKNSPKYKYYMDMKNAN